MPSKSRETWVVGGLTTLALIPRLWGFGRMGLIHFDEGVYAAAGLWALDTRGLAGLDPSLIPYAPPLFPILIGALYALLGVTDLAPILVSDAAGTATIPVVAWLGRRAFGPGAGAGAAALAALSGTHVAFSRMGLTDSLFLLSWLLALASGAALLERPNVPRALLFGILVGVAQLVKYNGWLTGLIVACAALAGVVRDRDERGTARLARVFGCGALAAVAAAVCCWPWFQFVEAHGGYASLLRHQRGYVGGVSSWFGFWRSQLDQVVGLSGGPIWCAGAWGLAILAAGYANGSLSRDARRLTFVALAGLGIAIFALVPTVAWWVGFGWLSSRALSARAAERVVGSSWLVMSILTPMYHPYARLWLPLHAAGWIMIAGLIIVPASRLATLNFVDGKRRLGRSGVLAIAFSLLALAQTLRPRPAAKALPGLFEPTDSVRIAAGELLASIPKEVRTVRALARPSVLFYLAGRVGLDRVGSEAELLLRPEPGVWLLDDRALSVDPRSSRVAAPGSTAAAYRLDHSFETKLNLPTLLDVDPGAAREPWRSPMTTLDLYRIRTAAERQVDNAVRDQPER